MQNHPKQDFETYHKCFQDFETEAKFSKSNVYQGNILYPYKLLPTLATGHSASAGNYTRALGTIKTCCKTCTKLSFLCQQSQASEISTQPHTSYCMHFLTQSLFMFAVYITCGRVKMFTYISRQYLSRHPML